MSNFAANPFPPYARVLNFLFEIVAAEALRFPPRTALSPSSGGNSHMSKRFGGFEVPDAELGRVLLGLSMLVTLPAKFFAPSTTISV